MLAGVDDDTEYNHALWRQLVAALDEWTTASELATGHIEVSVPDGTGIRPISILMTADEWADMCGPMWGDVGDAIEEVKRTLMEMKRHETYALYGQYKLVPSTEATWPERPRFSPQPGSKWFTYCPRP
jgi:hypothetical protein